MLLYDLLLFIFRFVTYEVPVVGGRARGRSRPRAPSLTERPSGRPRRFSIARRNDVHAGNTTDAPGSSESRFRNITEEKEDVASKI